MSTNDTPTAASAEALKTMALRMAALVDALEDRSLAVVDASRANREALARAAATVDAAGPRLVEAATQAVRNEAASALASGLGSSVDEIRKALAAAAEDATNGARRLAAERDALGRQQRRAFWTGAVALGVGAVLIVASCACWVAQARAEVEALAFPAAVHAATASGALRACGDKVCARVGTESRRAGERGEYLVVE
ncbi:MAG: hypothetical protein ACK52N_02510 [Lysobacteraceae bacterium]